MGFICSKGSVAEVEERADPSCPYTTQGTPSNQGDHGSPPGGASSSSYLGKLPMCHWVGGAGQGFLKNGPRAAPGCVSRQWWPRDGRRGRSGNFNLVQIGTWGTGRPLGSRRENEEVLSIRHLTADWFHFFLLLSRSFRSKATTCLQFSVIESHQVVLFNTRWNVLEFLPRPPFVFMLG